VAVAALLSNRIDFIYSAMGPTAEFYAKQNPDLKAIPLDSSIKVSWQMVVRKSDTTLLAALNKAFATLKANGEMEKLRQRYITSGSMAALATAPTPSSIPTIPDAPELVMGVTGTWPPFDYVSADGKPMGYSVALTEAVTKLLGINLKMVPLETEAVFPALESGRIDIYFIISNKAPVESKFARTDSYVENITPALLVRK
jgi:ABC-type amino acid transport substrate-binding protein